MGKRIVSLIICVLILSGMQFTHAASSYVNIGDTSSNAVDILSSSTVFTADLGTWYSNGEKKNYTDYMAEAYSLSSGEIMVSASLVEDVMGVSSTEDYVNVNSLARNMGKYLYSDGRGFVVISDKELNLSDSESLHKNMEDSDIVYRYMQYDRPDAEAIITAIKSNCNELRPRIFMRGDDTENFVEKIYGDVGLQNELKTLLKTCEGYLDENGNYVPEERKTTQSEGTRIFGACARVRNKIINLAVAYYATGNEKYLDHIWQECDNVLNWDDWNFKVSFLDSAQMVPGIALGYDMLCTYLSDEQRQSFEDRMLEKYINYAVGVYTGESAFKITDGRMTGSNWGAVCGTAMLLTGLSFIDENNPDSEISRKCAFLASSALQGLEYPAGTLCPDGSVREGLEYWTYYVDHLVWSINALINSCGNDYGFLSSKGIYNTIDYGLNMQTLNYGFNFSTTPTTNLYLSPELFAIANLYGDSVKMEEIRSYYENSGKSLGARGLLFYNNIEASSGHSALKYDNYFSKHHIVTMRSSYNDKNASYVGILGGHNETGSQFDKGSFVFETNGTRWISDLGDERKDVSGGYYHNEGWSLYKKRTEGHNCLVINPYSKDKIDEFIEENDGKDYNVNNDDPRYVGQAVGNFARVSRFESAKNGAIAVYDLSEVYGNQVTEYKRGFYFGDERKSLTVRDELSLTEENSDIYWFVHSQDSEITIVNDNKLIINKDDKNLICEIQTDLPQYTLSVVEAQPLDTNLIRDGEIKEYSRDSYKKISLYAKAEGEFFIGAKFYMENDTCTDDYADKPISGWEIPTPAPAVYSNPEFISSDILVSDGNGYAYIEAKIPCNVQRLNLYMNDELLLSKTSDFSIDGNESFIVNVSSLKTLNALLRLECICDGVVLNTEKNVIIYDSSNTSVLADRYFDDLSNDDDESDVESKIKSQLHLCYTYESQRIEGFDARGENNCLKLSFENSGEMGAGYLYKTRLGVSEGKCMSVVWKLTTYDPIKMYFSASGTTPTRINTVPVLFGTYVYNLFLDGSTYVLTITNESGKLIYSDTGDFVAGSGGFTEFRLKFYGIIPGCELYIENVKFLLHSYIKPYDAINQEDEKVNISLGESSEFNIYKAIYNNGILKDISLVSSEFLSVDENDECKIFAFDKNVGPVLKYMAFGEVKER